MYFQKRNKNVIKIDFKNNGIEYSLKDESINMTDFIPYENITNNKHEVYESNKSFKNYAIYTGVIGAIFLAINIFDGTRLWAWLFLLACPTFIILFKISQTSFTVIDAEDKMQIFVINDRQKDEIIEKIYNNRDEYLKKHFGKIDYDNDKENEISKFVWLMDLGLINEREFDVIKEEIQRS